MREGERGDAFRSLLGHLPHRHQQSAGSEILSGPLFAESLIVVLLNSEEFLAVRITVRTTQNAQSNVMTLTHYINAFLPGSTIEQVSEEWKIRQSDFSR